MISNNSNSSANSQFNRSSNTSRSRLSSNSSRTRTRGCGRKPKQGAKGRCRRKSASATKPSSSQGQRPGAARSRGRQETARRPGVGRATRRRQTRRDRPDCRPGYAARHPWPARRSGISAECFGLLAIRRHSVRSKLGRVALLGPREFRDRAEGRCPDRDDGLRAIPNRKIRPCGFFGRAGGERPRCPRCRLWSMPSRLASSSPIRHSRRRVSRLRNGSKLPPPPRRNKRRPLPHGAKRNPCLARVTRALRLRRLSRSFNLRRRQWIVASLW